MKIVFPHSIALFSFAENIFSVQYGKKHNFLPELNFRNAGKYIIP
jgi:hypothetical protein